MKSILPQYVTATPHSIYNAIGTFLKEYNRHLQSKEIIDLVEAIERFDSNSQPYEMWFNIFINILKESNVLNISKKMALDGLISIDTYDAYLSTIQSLEEYNKKVHSEEVICVAAALGQFHIAQWIFQEWENAFKKSLLELGTIKDTEMHTIKKWG